MMEGKMVELSQLLGLFTGKLMEQQDQVDEVHEAAVGTQENVGQANEELLTTLHRNSKASQTMLTFVITLCIAMLIFDQIIP
jgi:t-SNARE complex subunit (syntaxin)